MITFDVYGFSCKGAPGRSLDNMPKLDKLVRKVAVALDVTFQARDSYFLNGLYYLHESIGHGKIEVLNNIADDDPEDAPYMENPEFQVILRVDNSAAPDDLRQQLQALGFTHISRSIR